MLQNIRDNAQGTIAKIIVGLIVLTFALFGVESIVGGLSGEPEVASVNGESITEANFQRQLELRRRQVINQMGENYDPSLIDENAIRSATLTDLISREVRLQSAVNKDMAISDSTVENFILQWPAAQVEGKFNRDQFLAVLRNIGMNPLEFREQLKKDLMINQMRMAIAQSSFVIDQELVGLLKIERQKRTFDYKVMDAAAVAEGIEVPASETEAYYNDHQEEFRLPERVVVNYIEVKKEDLAKDIQVTDDEVKQAYDEEVSSFKSEEQRRGAHILVETSDTVSDEQALEKINAVAKRLADGEDFATVAKEVSDDLGSAQEGGDLGFAGKGAFVPEFEEALFSMNKGEVSAPVKTDYGYHIIKLVDVTKQEPPTLEESRDRIVAKLQNEKSESRFVELSTELTDITYSALDLKGPADELGLEVKTSKPFSKDGGEGVFSNPAVLQQVFSDDVLKNDHNSEVVEVGRDTLVVVRKNELIPSMIRPLEDVSKGIANKLALEKAKEQVNEEVDQVVQAASKGETSGDDWSTAEDVRRGNPGYGEATAFAFKMPVPNGSEPVVQKFETDAGFIVVALKSVDNGTEELTDTEKKTYMSFLANRLGSKDFESFDSMLQNNADIKRL
ncbi:parvulin peptidyl-prolyl isomerase [Hahella sp. CCB-MM4]|uniref:SurA N-terminal domain-containing protein n=1 Tax=Hahella sp. (strain CCB-MM4) TaxID=1926491 RepID=UPI000B9BBDB4|nr:SurA N-terminal domain-containing protein [Hahella sp. CCB-MM4]OZG71284.1 parvulin peptidyl-prolyl isomerase [Hahella sp. CCB-MM4]